MSKNLSKERIEKLEESKKVLLNLVNDIDKIIEGNTTQADVARKYSMTPQEFNRNIGLKFGCKLKFLDLLNYEDFIEIYKSIELPSDRLLRAVLGLKEDSFALLPKYDEEALYGFLDSLTERDKKIILLRYGTNDEPSNLSFRQCGKLLDISEVRVEQLESRFLKKIRGSLKEGIIIGYSELNELRKVSSKNSRKILEEKKELQARIELDKDLFDKVEGAKDILDNLYRVLGLDNHGIPLNTNIAEFGFSVRTYNCLHRAGYNTLNDIVESSKADLMKVRNLGRKSYDEVLNKLREMGIELKEE